MPDHFRRALLVALTAAFLLSYESVARGQIYVTRFLMSASDNGVVGKYNLDGTPINPSLISGPLILAPYGIAVSGDDLYLTTYLRTLGTGFIGKYTTSGASINGTLVTGLQEPGGLAVSGDTLFVADFRGRVGAYTTSGATVNAALVTVSTPRHVAVSGTDLYVSSASGGPSGTARIGKYTTSGATINANFIPNLPTNDPEDMVVHEGHLYVANFVSNTISQYTTSGDLVNPALVTGLNRPIGLALFEGHLYVANFGNGTVGQYRLDGTPVNPALITGLQAPLDIAVVPEPSLGALVAGCAGVLLAARARVRDARAATASTNQSRPGTRRA